MSLAGEGSNDGPWLYVVFMSVIFKVQVHLATSSLLDQLSRNLTGKHTHHKRTSDEVWLINNCIIKKGIGNRQPVKWLVKVKV